LRTNHIRLPLPAPLASNNDGAPLFHFWKSSEAYSIPGRPKQKQFSFFARLLAWP
jgi:hypothetical protein